MVIEIEDDGTGMPYEVLKTNFWDLGNSASLNDPNKIGEKGHGTKIYLRSQKVEVITHHKTGSYESRCDLPFKFLNNAQMHSPKLRSISPSGKTGTKIRVEGYNDNERSAYLQNVVRDYILWFTMHGSFKREFDEQTHDQTVINLKCLDTEDFETLPSGHVFGKQTPNIDNLFKQYSVNAADLFVKKYVKVGNLTKYPEISFHAVVYVEGDEAKRQYNRLLTQRKRSPGQYRVADRYGIWLGKDFIPVQRVNEWVTGFGTGSNSFVLLHGFVNCQNFKLTANRGSIANTAPEIISEIEIAVKEFINEIDEDISKNGLYVLKEWQVEEKTLKIERAEFERRKKSIPSRKTSKFEGRLLLEPSNESELFGLLTTVYSLKPDLFDFEPLDYSTNRGIDILGRNKVDNIPVADCEFWYIELKFLLGKKFNHSFQNIRWIICWDFDRGVKHESILESLIETGSDSIRTLKFEKDDEGFPIYFLEKPNIPTKIMVIRLREYLEKRVGVRFE